jgi:hypothetical protein
LLFGLDPCGKAPQQHTAEVFTIEKGMAPIKVPGALKQLKLFVTDRSVASHALNSRIANKAFQPYSCAFLAGWPSG